MKTAKPDPGQRAKCVGWDQRTEMTVRHSLRIKPSRDGDPLKVQPGHRPAQRHGLPTALPESGKIHGPAQFRKPRPQPQPEGRAPCLQPTPPAAGRAAIHSALSGGLMQGAAAEQTPQHHLLKRPTVPTPGCDAFRQPRAGLAAALAIETRNGHRIHRTRRLRPTIRLADIATMPPKSRQAAMGTGRRPVNLRFTVQRIQMLLKGKNRRYHPLHRPVSFVRVESLKNFPR